LTRDVPAQLVPAPALQSFFPAFATPKHFSVAGAPGAAAAFPTRVIAVAAANAAWDIFMSLPRGLRWRKWVVRFLILTVSIRWPTHAGNEKIAALR
jgi:hypothetical protein